MRTAITIAVVAAGLLAVPPAAAAEPGDVARTDLRREEIRAVPVAPATPELTDEQRAEFRQAATAAGLSAADIDRALDDPQLLATVPVYVEIEKMVITEPAEPGGIDVPHTNMIRGYSDKVVARYYNFWRLRMFSFGMTKYWESNGRRIVYAPGPRAWANVTGNGGLHGWSYKGISSSSDHYFTYKGTRYGGHVSFRQGRFEQCFLKYGCVWQRYPRLTIAATYTGASSVGRAG